MTESKKSVFETLSKIDVSKHVETINMHRGPALKYVSWAWAWSMVKKAYPNATREINEYPEFAFDRNTGRWYATGQKLDYRITPAGCEVSVTVHIENESYTERLYVMDMRNQPVQNPNIAQINKTQQRCLVKALAMAGLGLNIYAGEDLPMGDIDDNKSTKKQQPKNQSAVMEARKKTYKQVITSISELMETDKKTVASGIAQQAQSDERYKEASEEERLAICINIANKMQARLTQENKQQQLG